MSRIVVKRQRSISGWAKQVRHVVRCNPVGPEGRIVAGDPGGQLARGVTGKAQHIMDEVGLIAVSKAGGYVGPGARCV